MQSLTNTDTAELVAGGGECAGGIDLASAMSAGEQEVARLMQICNACRYCEGFCAVFPAMTRRLEFHKADTHYPANLCHNCGSCLYACQYAPPHEFAVNVPQAMAKVRVRTYQDYAWPAPLGRLYELAGLTVALALASGLALFLLLAVTMRGPLIHASLAGNFYAIFPHNFLAVIFGSVFLFSILALGVGVTRFWRQISPTKGGDVRDVALAAKARAPAAAEALVDVARLRYLGGGHGDGCNEDDDAFTLWRRRFHHFTMYGFLLCFAATSVATLYHYLLAFEAPYPFFSAPVLLGTLGGAGLIVGPSGLLWLNMRRDPQRSDPGQAPMDRGFIALLLSPCRRLRPCAAGVSRRRRHGVVACNPSRRRDGTVSDAALRQVRARPVPLGRLAKVRDSRSVFQTSSASAAIDVAWPEAIRSRFSHPHMQSEETIQWP